jgi:hypothetical protein
MIAQALLVILIGIYFIRTSWFLFSDMLSPLTPVAAVVLITCLFAFHRPPTSLSLWFWGLMAICVLGAITNATLLFSASPMYSNPTNTAFSAISLGCFVLLGGNWAITAMRFGHP